jgi:glycosyltransferase involved in cell wall biosynthesis
MSVYNSEKFLKYSIESILNQTYHNFEFIIIDDGSTDSSVNIINQYKKLDKRIIFIHYQNNKGLTVRLNQALKKSSYNLIARQDSDDISCPKRFKYQVQWFKKNISGVMCGTNAIIIDENNNHMKNIFLFETDYKKICKKLVYQNCFVHSSVMIKKDALLKVGNYQSEFKYAQDYDLFCRLSRSGIIENIPKKLIKIRKHSASITSKNLFDQTYFSILSSVRYYAKIKNIDFLYSNYKIEDFLKNNKTRLFVRSLIFLHYYDLKHKYRISFSEISFEEFIYSLKFFKLFLRLIFNFLKKFLK